MVIPDGALGGSGGVGDRTEGYMGKSGLSLLGCVLGFRITFVGTRGRGGGNEESGGGGKEEEAAENPSFFPQYQSLLPPARRRLEFNPGLEELSSPARLVSPSLPPPYLAAQKLPKEPASPAQLHSTSRTSPKTGSIFVRNCDPPFQSPRPLGLSSVADTWPLRVGALITSVA